MTDPQHIHQAERALRRAIADVPDGLDGFDHPDHRDVIALADGQLSDVDREIVESHVARCAQCAEDVADIAAMRMALAAITPVDSAADAVTDRWKYAVAALAAAAVLFLAVKMLGPRPMRGALPPDAQRSAPAVGAAGESAATSASVVPPRELMSVEEQAIVNAALASGRVDLPANIRALAGAMGTLLGASGASATSASMLPLAPAGTAVTDDMPELSWQPMAGAVSYRVAIFDQQFNELASSPSLTRTRWTPAVALPRGSELAWQVTAHLTDGSDVLAPAPPQPEARFTVLDATKAAAIIDLRERLKDQPIALGILLATSGLVDEAATAFDRAASDPAVARQAAALRASLGGSR